MCDNDAALADFPDLAALFDALHGPDGDAVVRNAILAALVRRAQADAEPAATVLLLALWPGLDAVHRRLARHVRGDRDALVSEIPARVVTGIHALDLTRVSRIAATLIRNCERDIVRSLRRRGAEARFSVSGLDEELPERRAISVLGLLDGLDPDEAVARLVELLEAAIGADARLVVAIAVVGERQHPAAAALGLSPDAGRKRYQRALKRLRLLLEEIT